MTVRKKKNVYKTLIISTIVDLGCLALDILVYKTLIISTIVDTIFFDE